MKANRLVPFLFTISLLGTSHVVEAQNVRVTPLGSRTGEFSAQDCALLFEDPTGVRILYDPGNTVAGGTDSRLGEVHVILASHAHSDHIGSARLNQDPSSNSGSCGTSASAAAPNTNIAEIAAARNSAILAGSGLANFLGRMTAVVRGANTAGCPSSGLTNEFTVPRTAPCSPGVGIGSKRTVRHTSAEQGVQITAVNAEHPNDLSSAFLSDSLRTALSENGLGAYVGPANGFVVTFTNGLSVYLSRDTGLADEMKSVVRGPYGAKLAVINIGDTFTTGPEEAAFAVTDLIGATAVIPSHANEAATQRGSVIAGTRTARFIEILEQGALRNRRRSVPVYVPLSGMTMEFHGNGNCVAGC